MAIKQNPNTDCMQQSFCFALTHNALPNAAQFPNIYHHIHFKHAVQSDDSTVPTHLTISLIRHAVIKYSMTLKCTKFGRGLVT
jgi:hypothetical protein